MQAHETVPSQQHEDEHMASRWWFRGRRHPSPSVRTHPAPKSRLAVEGLEDRVNPATTFTTTDATFALNAGTAGVVVTRTGDLTAAVTVAYTVTGGTAAGGTNYQAPPSGTLYFPSGTASETIPLSVLPNNFSGGDRSLSVDLVGVVDVTAAAPTFAPRQTLQLGGAPGSAAIAYINGGLADLITVDPIADTVSVSVNAGDVFGQTLTFLPAATFPTGSRPGRVVVADLDGDGRLDLVIPNTDPNNSSVSVLLNTSTTDVSFAPQQVFATETGATSVAVADVNRDGTPDLVVTNVGSDAVSVLLNTTPYRDSSLTFAAPVSVPTAGTPGDVKLADVNSDGRPDIIVTKSSSSIAVLLNTTADGAATPSFAPEQTFATGADPSSLAVADLNRDARPDLVVANAADDALTVLLNTTPAGAAVATFATQAPVPTGDSPTAVAVADVNGDRKPDVLVASSTTDTVGVYLNTTLPGAAAATFGPVQPLATDGGPAALVVGELNNDGVPETVTANPSSGTVSLLRNTSPAGFDPFSYTVPTPRFEQAPVAPPTGDSPAEVAAADLNGDGKPDLVVANQDSKTVSVYLNTTEPGASPAFAARLDLATADQCVFVTTADVNGDGRPDVIASSTTSVVSVFLNTTTPGAAVPSFAQRQDFTAGLGPIATGDANGDGRVDLFVSNFNSHTVSVLLNATDPGAAVAAFAPRQEVATSEFSTGLVVADVNGDGRVDVFFADTQRRGMVVLNTTPTGAAVASFGPPQNFTLGNGTFAATAADLNVDGRPDIVTANLSDPATGLSILLNTTEPGSSAASFAPTQSISTVNNGPVKVVAADLNGDGKPDLIVPDSVNFNLWVLTNLTNPGAGTASFALPQYVPTGYGPTAVAAADLNGDGLPDLVAPGRWTQTVSLLVNTPAAGGRATVTLVPAPVVTSITKADSDHTNAATVRFVVTFSKAVSGVSGDNFSLTGTGAASAAVGTPTTADGGVTWTVPVTTGAAGTLQLTLADRAGIADAQGNALYNTTADDGSAFAPVAGPAYTIVRVDTSLSGGPSGFTTSRAARFAFAGSTTPAGGRVTFQVSLDGAPFAAAASPVSYANLADGPHTFAVRAVDQYGNADPTPATRTWVVDTVKPTVSVSPPSAPAAKTGDTVTYAVTYADATLAAVTLTAADVTLVRTGTARGTVQVTGTGSTRTVTVTNITGDGTLAIAIRAGTAADQVRLLAPAARGAAFVVDNTAPVVAVAPAGGSARVGGAAAFTVTYTDATLAPATLTAAQVALVSPAGVTGTVAVTKTAANRFTVTVSNLSAKGTVAISVAAGAAEDAFGRLSPGPVTSRSVAVR